MKKVFTVGILICLSIFLVAIFSTDFTKIYSLPEKAYVSTSDIDLLNKQKTFGHFLKISISDATVSNQKKTTAKMWVKLFGIIPIKQIEVELSEGEEVYLGGTALGFSITTKGLLVVGTNTISSKNGDLSPTLETQIQKGDFLTHIDGIEITEINDVTELLNTNQTSFNLTLSRDGIPYNCTVYPEKDLASGDKKLGLWVKNDANGIGTLTFIRQSDNRFGALGHAITDYETGVNVPVESGKIYKCSQVGITKASKNCPGELKCVFLQGINTKGTIEKNTPFGVFGNCTDASSIADFNRTAEIGSRLTIKSGKAKLLSAVSGVLEEYDIEIIKTYYQPDSDDKSFIFRVTDKRLLELTGGIVQGMSGSPILQNGKLVGATTHVFVSDPTKGYGIYADWMAEE